MGNWNISIRGIGSHHNSLKTDAENMAADFVRKLKEIGHIVEDASFVYGGADDLVVIDLDRTPTVFSKADSKAPFNK